MPWKAAHPASTTTANLPEDADAKDQATFTIGFWPPFIAEKLNVLRAEITKPGPDLHPIRDANAFAEATGLSIAWYRTMVKYGLRDWKGVEIDGKEVKIDTKTEEIDGRKHTAVSEEHIDVLYHGSLLVALGMKCWVYNVLSEVQKKEFDLQSASPSSKSPTSAKSARRNGKAKGPPSGSLTKTTKKSKAVPTK